jgi:hypothetical protein
MSRAAAKGARRLNPRAPTELAGGAVSVAAVYAGSRGVGPVDLGALPAS